jgi:hypothetical protein
MTYDEDVSQVPRRMNAHEKQLRVASGKLKILHQIKAIEAKQLLSDTDSGIPNLYGNAKFEILGGFPPQVKTKM